MPENSIPRLFAVVLGGRAPGCTVELHDVAFAVGYSLEDIYPQLLDRWFGEPRGLHVDAWATLDQVPGYRVRLERSPAEGPVRLYFINIGGYKPGEFGEQHAYGFYAGAGKAEVKLRAKDELLIGRREVHKDDLFQVEDCVPIGQVDGWHVHLQPDPQATAPRVTNGYFPLPKATIDAWEQGRG